MKESLQSIREWASEIRQGNFSARLQRRSETESDSLTDDINRLAEWLESLAEDQEAQIQAQQSRLEHESSRVLRFEERTRLANELHDSLAQTLASLKIQVRVLDDTLRQDNEAALWQEMERIQATLDDANTKCGTLSPTFDHRLIARASFQQLKRLSRDLDTSSECRSFCRISGATAALIRKPNHRFCAFPRVATNAGKHSEASMARVLLTYGPVGRCRVVIEDDGSGFRQPRLSPKTQSILVCRSCASVRLQSVLNSKWKVNQEKEQPFSSNSMPGDGYGPTAGRGSKMKALLIDDHALFGARTRRPAGAGGDRDRGFAGQWEDAVRVVRKTAPDVVLLDLRMPEIGGLDVLKMLTDRKSAIPVVMLTTSPKTGSR
ncbi:MAG: hypothetical protein Ct9H300mP16_13680 [Pseudomonadota bacterium]|nr:MAG: hypothetical protein Ct9H300mP16_13680 [Pseudomonadota bacterium]